MEDTFTRIYERRVWGNNNNPEYSGSSGHGSAVDYNIHTYVPFLKKFIVDNHIRSVVDLGCGDFRCGPLIYDDLAVTYVGYDAYKKAVDYNGSRHDPTKYTFRHLDFCNAKEQIQGGDLCILKDVIQHWPLEDIYRFLDYLVEEKRFTYILICNCCDQKEDNTTIRAGDWRPLSSQHLPLKKYAPIQLYRYDTKEVSLIVV